MLDNGTVDNANLPADDFYSPAHSIFASVIRDLVHRQIPATALTVAEELERRGQLTECGGWEKLNSLLDSLPSEVWHVDYHARLIRDAAMRRKLIQFSRRLEADCYGHEDISGLHALCDRAQREIFEDGEGRRALSIHDVLLQRRDLQHDARPHIASGFVDLDKQLSGGMRGGSLIIIGARPSVGKTSFALDMFLAGAQADCFGLFISMEQSQIEVANRLLAAKSGLPFADIEGDRLTDGLDCERLAEAENELARLRMKIIDQSGLRLSQIVASARAERRNGLRLVILDYLQLIRADDERQPREQQVASLSRGLKHLARDLDCVVVCLAQLNRGIEGRDRKQPRLSDLRESGSIEQDADVVMFLDRPATYDPDADPSEANVIVAKNRNGPCGKVPLLWHGPTMSYRSPAPSWQTAASASHWFPPTSSSPSNSVA